MIPSDLPLPNSSQTQNMSQSEQNELAERWHAMMTQSEQNELAERWHAMMIKDEVDNEGNSTLSSLTPSISVISSNDLQEQRDPRANDRLLEQHMSYKDYVEDYPTKPQNSPQKSNSKTDFLDGIIQSLSELSKHERTSGRAVESRSILQEKKNGWSIHDSHRRAQEYNESQRRLQERSQRRWNERTEESESRNDTSRYQSDGDYDGDYSENKPQKYDPYEPRSQPPIGRSRSAPRREASRYDYNDARMVGEGEPRRRSSSAARKYDTQSTGGNSRSQRSSRTMQAGEFSTNSFRKTRSWNLDKSLRNNISLFDNPTSPESAQSSREPSVDPIFQHGGSSTRSGQHGGSSVQSNLADTGTSSGGSSDKYSGARHETIKIRKSVPRDRTPSLAFSDSKNAGHVLQHFAACAPVNAAANGAGALDNVVGFFDNPVGSMPSKKISTRTQSSRQSRSQSRSDTQPKSSRRSAEHFVPNESEKLPKTSAQKEHEREILRRLYHSSPQEAEGPEMQRERWNFRDGRRSSSRKKNRSSHDRPMSSSRKPKAPSEGAPPDDFEAIWAADETPAKYEANAPINLRSIATSALSLPGHRKSTKGKPGAEGTFMQQLSGCNASGLKTNQSASSPSAIKMFEKIQRQLTVPTTIDSSGFPMDTIDGNNGTRQKQRIQEKLDAVRARSLRNAQIFQKMENKGKVNVTTDEEGKELSFASFDDPNIDVITSINEVEDSATGSTAKGKRLDQLFDKNTSQDVVMTPATNKTASSNEKRPSSAELVAQTTAPENESSHFMYVGYSQFGVDAHKVLKLCGHNSIPAPDRRKGEILVRINASLVSATDCAIRRGEWKDMKLDPYIIPGIAFVGKAMGREKKRTRASSSNIEPGDSVLALVREGANARYIALEKKCLIKVPPQLDAERVVCLSETYLTAFQALHLGQRGGMRYRDNSLQGRSILIMNGYSPLGKAIIELARLSGASICYGLISDNPKNPKDGMGTSSVEMHQRFKKLEQWGAIPLSSDPQDWLTLIGRQIDIFVTTYDPNEEDRGDNEITADHWKALKKDGQVHVVCSLPGMSEVEQRNMILGSQPSNKAIDTKAFRLPSCRPGGREKMADRAVYYNLFDSYMGDRLSKVTARKDLEHLIKLMEADLIHPQVAERVSLSKIAKAQRTLEHNKITGEGHLVCIPWLREKPKEQQKSTTKKQAKDVQKDVKYEV